jgi:hypothetical protein
MNNGHALKLTLKCKFFAKICSFSINFRLICVDFEELAAQIRQRAAHPAAGGGVWYRGLSIPAQDRPQVVHQVPPQVEVSQAAYTAYRSGLRQPCFREPFRVGKSTSGRR